MLKFEPKNSYERAELLLGLKSTGANASDLKRVSKALLDEQRRDGGWSQNPNLASDAYATGLALHALAETGTAATESAYRRGVDYLIRTQLEDAFCKVARRENIGEVHSVNCLKTLLSLMKLKPVAGCLALAGACRQSPDQPSINQS